MTSRRSFLTLLGGAALAPLAAKLVYEPAKFLLPPDPLAADGSLLGITTAIERGLCERLGLPYPVNNVIALGQCNVGADGIVGLPADAPRKLTEGDTQFHVSACLMPERELDVQKNYLNPITDALAAYARDRGLRGLRRPQNIGDQGIDAAYGHLVRGARMWDPYTDECLLRFDVVGRAA